MARLPLLPLATCVAALLACKGDPDSTPTPPPSAPPNTASIAASVAAPPAATDSVTFSSRVPPPGTGASFTTEFDLKVTERGKVTRFQEREQAELEVKANDGFRITGLVIEVRDKVEIEQDGTRPEKRTTSPLAGSTYIMTRGADGKLAATTPGGAPIAPALRKLLVDAYGDRFEKDTTGAFLPNRPVKLGEKLFPASASMLGMLGIKDDGKTTFEGTEFLLEEVTDGIAVFHVEMLMTVKMPAARRLRAKLSGKMRFLVDGTWTTGINLSGPLTVVDSLGNEKADGSWTMKATQTFR